jgi:hypothetical protein
MNGDEIFTCFMILVVAVLFGYIIYQVQIVNGGSIYLPNTSVSCDKIVVISDKYSQINDNGRIQFTVKDTNGKEYMVLDPTGWNNRGLWSDIPANETINIITRDNSPNIIVAYKRVYNVMKNSEDACINCCDVQYKQIKIIPQINLGDV